MWLLKLFIPGQRQPFLPVSRRLVMFLQMSWVDQWSITDQGNGKSHPGRHSWTFILHHSLPRSHSLVWTLTLALQSPTPNISPWSNDWFCAPIQHCPASTVSVTFQWSCVPHGALTPTYCSTMAYKLVTRTPEHPPSWLRWRPFMTNFVPTIISRAFVLISWPSLSGEKTL